MAPNSLSPASVKINYHTAFGAHSMTIPTLDWLPTNLTGVLGSYLAWDGTTSVDAEEMINDLVDLLKVFSLPAFVYDLATIYTQANPTADNIPRRSAGLTQIGTGSSSDFTQAQSSTFNFKTTANGDAKIVLLDAIIGPNGFNAIHPSDFTAGVLALEAEFTSNLVAWAGRDDARPSVLRKITYDLNDKLQKLYRMGQ